MSLFQRQRLDATAIRETEKRAELEYGAGHFIAAHGLYVEAARDWQVLANRVRELRPTFMRRAEVAWRHVALCASKVADGYDRLDGKESQQTT